MLTLSRFSMPLFIHVSQQSGFCFELFASMVMKCGDEKCAISVYAYFSKTKKGGEINE